MQAPIKDRYKSDPGAAVITLKAKGTLDDQEHRLARSRPAARSRSPACIRRPAAPGMELCSGDMLLGGRWSLRAGVTLKAVSTALAIPLKSGTVSAEGDLDFRGTLGARQGGTGRVPRDPACASDVETDAPQDKLDQLLKLTDAAIASLYQTIAKGPPVAIKMQRV